jgi:hypothetical protein
VPISVKATGGAGLSRQEAWRLEPARRGDKEFDDCVIWGMYRTGTARTHWQEGANVGTSVAPRQLATTKPTRGV